MLNSKGFDLWSDGYDKSVNLSEEANEYPFAGYRNLLDTIYNIIRNGKGKNILDIGFGTGVLMKKLYDQGYSVYGMDFSKRMVEIAQDKMPNATLIQHDFSTGFPSAFSGQTFDFIVCTYAIHHLEDSQKVVALQQWQDRLSADGKILIGDVAFSTVDELEQCKIQSGDSWDEDEIYPIYENLNSAFPSIQFEKISFCAGVFTLAK